MQPTGDDLSSSSGGTGSFTFAPLKASLPSLADPAATDSLRKWNLEPFMRSASFRFDQAFTSEQADAFLLDFFSSAAFGDVCTAPGKWAPLGRVTVGAVRHQRMPTTVLRLDFFDRLKEAGIVRAGDIAKCLDVQCGDVLVSDRLRKLLLDDGSEEWELFSEAERKELIFHVLQRLAVGGGMNQYDDAIEPYLQLTRAIYKDLVTVNKSAGGTLQVSSLTFLIDSVRGENAQLFPRQSPHNFCYVCVDPIARHVKLWYAAWWPMM